MIDNLVKVCRFDSCHDAQTYHICGDKRCQTVARCPGKYCPVRAIENMLETSAYNLIHGKSNLLMLGNFTNLKKLNINNFQLLH